MHPKAAGGSCTSSGSSWPPAAVPSPAGLGKCQKRSTATSASALPPSLGAPRTAAGVSRLLARRPDPSPLPPAPSFTPSASPCSAWPPSPHGPPLWAGGSRVSEEGLRGRRGAWVRRLGCTGHPEVLLLGHTRTRAHTRRGELTHEVPGCEINTQSRSRSYAPARDHPNTKRGTNPVHDSVTRIKHLGLNLAKSARLRRDPRPLQREMEAARTKGKHGLRAGTGGLTVTESAALRHRSVPCDSYQNSSRSFFFFFF